MIRCGSTRRPGRLASTQTRGLRAAVVRLGPGDIMDWHSTRAREELLVALAGTVQLEVRLPSKRLRRMPLRAQQTALLPADTMHRVVNRSQMAARYLYVTASAA